MRLSAAKGGLAVLASLCSCASGETLPPANSHVQPQRSNGEPVAYWVTAVGGLRIRSQPSADSEVQGLIEQGAEIELDANGPTREATVGGRRGYWRRYKEGWVFDAFLERARHIYQPAAASGIPLYSTGGQQVRMLPGTTPVVVSPYSALHAFRADPSSQQAEWLEGTLTQGCEYVQGDTLRVKRADLRPAVPRWPFCSESVKRNCIDPALKDYVMAGTVNDRQDCVYQTALTLYPGGEVVSCPGRIGSWSLQQDGSIAIALQVRTYRTKMAPADEGVVITRPPLIQIRKVNVNNLRFPAESRAYWPQWKDNIRKDHFGGQDSGFLPVTPDNQPFAVFAYEC